MSIEEGLDFFTLMINQKFKHAKHIWNYILSIIHESGDINKINTKEIYKLPKSIIEKISCKENEEMIKTVKNAFIYYYCVILEHKMLRTNNYFCNYMIDLETSFREIKTNNINNRIC